MRVKPTNHDNILKMWEIAQSTASEFAHSTINECRTCFDSFPLMRQATTTTASSFWSPFSNQQNDYGIVDDSTCTRTASVKKHCFK